MEGEKKMKARNNSNFIKKISISKAQILKVFKRTPIIGGSITRTGMKYCFIGLKNNKKRRQSE